MTTRGSTRRHQYKEVDDELINKLLVESEHTQIMDNLQLYSVVTTYSDEQKGEPAPIHFHRPVATQAPVVLTFRADSRRANTWAGCRKAQPDYDSLLSPINAATDTLLYCQTLYNLAEEAGLSLCLLDTTLYNPESIIDTFQLPRLVVPVAIITLGQPDETPEFLDCLPLSTIIHDETYQGHTPERVDQFHHGKKGPPESTQFCQVNGKETLVQVFTGIRYTRESSEAMSENLLDTLKRQGLLQKPGLKNGLTYRQAMESV